MASTSYFSQERRNVATIFSRQHLRAETVDTGFDESNSRLPQRVQFILSDSETVIEADTDREISIGRHARPEDPEVTVDLQKYDAHALGVSRFHAIIKASRGALTLRDLDSVNGTLINGQAAIPLQRYILNDGDEITVGELKMSLRFIY